MILQWQGWWIDMYEFDANANPSGSMDGIACEVLATGLNRYLNRGWACMRTPSRDEALRIAAYFQALTSEDNLNGIAFPIAMPMNAQYEGDYRAWVVVEGSVSAEDPRRYGSAQNPGAGSYQVKSLSVLDPALPEGHLNARRTITRAELEGNIHLDSNVLPNLGMTYLPSGPNNTYELIVPAGCAGAMGHTYGCRDVWYFYEPSDQPPPKDLKTHWKTAKDFDGAFQMGILRQLLTRYPFYKLIPDQNHEIVVHGCGSGGTYTPAARTDDFTFALVYVPECMPIWVDMTCLGGKPVCVSWFDPRTAETMLIGQRTGSSVERFVPPSAAEPDFILILEQIS